MPIAWLPGEARDLAFMPMAARRALDRAGLKISLDEWRALPSDEQLRLAELGSAPAVDVSEVCVLVSGRAIAAVPEPVAPPAALLEVLPEIGPAWARLDPVVRHALEMYTRKGRVDRARGIYADSSGADPSGERSSGESQSSR